MSTQVKTQKRLARWLKHRATYTGNPLLRVITPKSDRVYEVRYGTNTKDIVFLSYWEEKIGKPVTYLLLRQEDGRFECDCPDAKNRDKCGCKHALAFHHAEPTMPESF